MHLELLQKESLKNSRSIKKDNKETTENNKERYISPEKRQEIIDKMRLK